jgi:hypothetical protein
MFVIHPHRGSHAAAVLDGDKQVLDVLHVGSDRRQRAVPAVLQPDGPVAELGAGDQVEPVGLGTSSNSRVPSPTT